MNNKEHVSALIYSLELIYQMNEGVAFPFPPDMAGLNGLVGANGEEIIKSFDLSNVYFLNQEHRVTKERYFPTRERFLND